VRDEEFGWLGAGNNTPAATPAVTTPAATPVPGPAESRAAPGAPAVVQVPAPVAQPAAPSGTPSAPQAPTVTPAVTTPPVAAQATETPEQIHARYQEHRQSRIAELAQRTFALDAQTVEQLQTEPEKVIPLLMAQSCMAAMEATLVAVSNYLPQAVNAIRDQHATVRAAEEDFYKAWPKLKNPQYEQALNSAGAFYRQLNPTASKEKFIQDVGLAVMAQMGLQADPPAPTAQPAAPRATPHSPIVANAPRTGPVTPTNRFAALAEDDMNGSSTGF